MIPHQEVVELSHESLLRAEGLPAFGDVLDLGGLFVLLGRVDIVAFVAFVVVVFTVVVDVWTNKSYFTSATAYANLIS